MGCPSRRRRASQYLRSYDYVTSSPIGFDACALADELDEVYETEVRPYIKDPEVEISRLKEQIRSSNIERLNELVLLDRRSNTVVSHRDVGIGVSQVLPVLVGAYVFKNRIIAMEQPEIHLHPGLQAEVGDVFIDSTLGEKRNTFILETHSEHLILRLMRRMRDTANDNLPESLPSVRPEDVTILYVQGKGSAAVVRRLELDEEGQLFLRSVARRLFRGRLP